MLLTWLGGWALLTCTEAPGVIDMLGVPWLLWVLALLLLGRVLMEAPGDEIGVGECAATFSTASWAGQLPEFIAESAAGGTHDGIMP